MANLLVEFKGNGVIKTWSKQYNFKCFIVPRNSVSTAIPEISKTAQGVYFLVNSGEGRKDNKNNSIKRYLYVGQTTKGMTRFFNHKSSKPRWDKIFLFTSDNDVFDETTISGLENYLISKYKESNLYEMEQENSKKNITEDSEYFGEQIAFMMDFYGYPLEEDSDFDDPDETEIKTQKEADNQAEITSGILEKLDKGIKAIAPGHIRVDQMKLYTAYKFEKKNVCAAWVRNYGLEIELYTNLKDITVENSGAYDVSFRRRGKKESAIKVLNEKDLSKALEVIKELINRL